MNKVIASLFTVQFSLEDAQQRLRDYEKAMAEGDAIGQRVCLDMLHENLDKMASAFDGKDLLTDATEARK